MHCVCDRCSQAVGATEAAARVHGQIVPVLGQKELRFRPPQNFPPHKTYTHCRTLLDLDSPPQSPDLDSPPQSPDDIPPLNLHPYPVPPPREEHLDHSSFNSLIPSDDPPPYDEL